MVGGIVIRAAVRARAAPGHTVRSEPGLYSVGVSVIVLPWGAVVPALGLLERTL